VSHAACQCNAGYFDDVDANLNALDCEMCDPGKFSAVGSQTEADCLACPSGKYWTAPSSICTSCPCGMTSSPEGSTAIANCTVNETAFNEPSACLLKTCSPESAVQCVMTTEACHDACDPAGFGAALTKPDDTYQIKLTDCSDGMMAGKKCCRVEVKYHNVWGTITVPNMTTSSSGDIDADMKTSSMLAKVMCRKAGCSSEGAVPIPGGFSHHVDGSSWRAQDMIWLNLVDMRNCSDLSESSTDFVQCMTKKWGEGDGEYGVGAGSDSPNPHDLDFGVCCYDGCTGVPPPMEQTCSNSAMEFYAGHRETHDCRYLPAPDCVCDASATGSGKLGCTV